MIAFYGILVVYLGQQVQSYREDIVPSLEQVDTSVGSFSYIVRPSTIVWANWSIQMDRESNAYYITSEDTWKDSPVEVLDPIATCIVNNYTEAMEWDEEVRDWLESRNITRFRAHYNLVVFSLNDLIHMIYREFPPPPGQYSFWYVQNFVNTNFPSCETSFLRWAERYSLFYSGILEIRSKISSALRGISEACLDSAKVYSQLLEDAIRENRTDDWFIESYQEMIQYEIAESTYYDSIFDSLSNIDSLVSASVTRIQRHTQFSSIAFSELMFPVIGMAMAGVVVPMAFLGVGDYSDSYKIKGYSLRAFRIVCTIACIALFVIFTYWGINIIWRLIYELYFFY